MHYGYFFFLLLWLAAATATESRKPLIRAPRDATTTGDYMVVVEENVSHEQFQQLVARISKMSEGAAVNSYVENVAKVITASLSPNALEMVRKFEGVSHIEEEDVVYGNQTPDLAWHIDRIDQSELPLDLSYQPIGNGDGVDVYILDSGIDYDHQEFEYRAKYAGYDPYDALQQRAYNYRDLPIMKGRDCHGHGTHVASLCGGKTYGTAKKVTLYSVRVLSCENSAPWSVVLDGLDFVSRIIPQRMKPAVVSMSLSGSHHASVDQAVHELYRKNITVVSAAGNGEEDCCSRSPASSPYSITVAGTRSNDGLYRAGRGTNFGRCVDMFAPGEMVRGASLLCTNCSKILSGTSMSTPIVAGIVAVHLSRQPLITPTQMKEKIVHGSLKDVIDFQGMPESYRSITPNRLITIPGSCGGSNFLLSQAPLHSPGFPNAYMNNLHCLWTISAEERQQVKVHFHFVSSEENFDYIQVFDGNCCEEKSLMATLSGDMGHVSLTYLSSSPTISILFVTDGITEMRGFNATYTKYYMDTDIAVPTSHITFPTGTLDTVHPPQTLYLNYQDTKDIEDILETSEGRGYQATWASVYHTDEDNHVDLILTNKSTVKTKCFVEVGLKSLYRTISLRTDEGYALWHISTRIRGRKLIRPAFYLIFRPLQSHLEYVHYILEDETRYLQHLEEKRNANFTLRSHSFFFLNGSLRANSVFVRDRRIALGLVPTSIQPQWISFHNLSVSDFSQMLFSLERERFSPTFVESYKSNAHNDSLIAVVFTEQLGNSRSKFHLGLNKTAAEDLVERERETWKPVMSVGYQYNGEEGFFLKFTRKQPSSL